MQALTKTVDTIADAWRSRAGELAAWAERLQNRIDACGGYHRDGSPTTHKFPPNLIAHFRGEPGKTIGLHALGLDNRSRFACVDIDQHAEDGGELAAENEAVAMGLAAELCSHGFNPIVENSNGNGGYHVWVFFDKPEPSADVFTFLEWLIRGILLNCDNCKTTGEKLNSKGELKTCVVCSGAGKKPPEHFPKQPHIDRDKGEFGNWIRLPGKHYRRNWWSQFWNGSAWLAGMDAVEFLLSSETSVFVMPAECIAWKQEQDTAAQAKVETRSQASFFDTSAEWEVSPIDDFEAKRAWEDLYPRLGLSLAGKRSDGTIYLRRDGSENQRGATLNFRSAGLLHLYSPNCGMPADRSYTKFKAWCFLEFGTIPKRGDDVSAEVASLIELGFGKRRDDVDLSGIMKAVSKPVKPETPAIIHGEEPDDPPVPEYADPGKLPEHLLKPGGFLGDVIEWNLRTAERPQPELALAGSLSLLSALTGRKLRDSSDVRTNLYTIGVCETGGGKEHSRKVIKKILAACGRSSILLEDAKSGAGIISALEADPVRLLAWDEIGRVLDTIKNPKNAPWLASLATTLLRIYSSAASTYAEEAAADMREAKVLDQPALIIMGSTTATTFFSSLDANTITNGLLGRVITFFGDERVRLRIVDDEPVPESIVEVARWWSEFQPGGNLAGRIPESPALPKTLRYDDEAKRRLQAYVDFTEDRRQATDNEWERCLRVREVETVRKLALLHSVSLNPETDAVSPTSLEWAIGVTEHCTSRIVHAAMDRISQNKYEADYLELVRFIRKRGDKGATASELARTFRSLEAGIRNKLLAHAATAGEIVSKTLETKGRPSTRYVANIRAPKTEAMP